MFDKSLAIVDLETTGMSARSHRIIEIAIIRIEEGMRIKKAEINSILRYRSNVA